MSNKINHWCVVCGTGYHACDTCDEIKSFTPWRALTDTVEHYQIFLILKQFNNGIIDKEEAKSMLSGLDLSKRDTFKESAKNVLNEIFKDETLHRKSLRKKSAENTVQNNDDIDGDVHIESNAENK